MTDEEKVIKALEKCRICECDDCTEEHASHCPWDCIAYDELVGKALALLKEQESVVHPEPSCEMVYITDCCCDLCGVQLIREDHFCRCCGKRIVWEGR